MGPEQLTTSSFTKLLNNKKFHSRLSRVVVDEAHCIKSWGQTFRPAYGALEHLQFVQSRLRYFLTTATLSTGDLDDIIQILHLQGLPLTIFRRSNDRPFIRYIAAPITKGLKTFYDLSFLLTSGHKFMVFTNSKREARRCIQALRRWMPKKDRHKLRWMSAASSDTYKEWLTNAFRNGDVTGVAVTDVASMVCVPGNRVYYLF
jgi:superfamily II DNA helicase RecQ